MKYEDKVFNIKRNGVYFSLSTRNGLEIKLRPAEERDCDMTYDWSSAKSKNFRTTMMPTREQWRDYFVNVYSPKMDDITFILESDKIPFGMMALDKIDGITAEVARTLRGVEDVAKGGMTVGVYSMVKFGLCDLGLSKIYLEVFSDNDSALNLYRRVGFCQFGPEYAMVQNEAGRWENHNDPAAKDAERYMTPMMTSSAGLLLLSRL